MAAKKSKVKAAVATKPATSKSAPTKGAAAKVATTKPAAAKTGAGKPTALQSVGRKATPKAKGKVPPAPSKGAKRAALNGRPQSALEKSKAPDSETFYFVVGHMDAQISNERLPSANEIASSESFHEVKDKAVDHLIALVDLLERRLWEIKRSQDFASYQALRELV
ncbi:MAG TPA: hypothetical protein VGJ26_00435 [Pirellulales bacterium]|jgi:hypothetical protein